MALGVKEMRLAVLSLKNNLLCLKKGEKESVEETLLGKVYFNSIFSNRIFTFTCTVFTSLLVVCVFAYRITDYL